MTDAQAVVALGGMFTGIVVTIAIVWGIVHGIRAHANGRQLPDPAVDRELTALRDQMDSMQQQLHETHERLDFTERLLARQHQAEQLPGSGGSAR